MLTAQKVVSKKRPVTANRKHTMGYDAIRRRTFLTGAGVAAVVTGLRPPQAFAQEGVPNSSRTEMQRRIGDVIHSYEEQGFHRTGTAVDQISGDWLIGQVREIGLEPT
jgi:hypothetical protein